MATSIYLKNTWSWVVGGPVISGGMPRWDLGIRGITFLNRLATSVTVTYLLNDSAVWVADVPSDNPEINIPTQDGDPFVAYNSRVLWGFRREGGTPPYVCRYAGLLMLNEDEATADEPVTHLTAYDPWMWLNSIPVCNADGSLPGTNGLVYGNKTGNFIAKDLIANGLALVVAKNPRNPIFVDVATGHFDTTAVIPEITFEQGMSVGEAWKKLTDTGTIDIVLNPVYDPSGTFLATMNCYSQAGSVRNAAVFGWDKFPRSLVGVSRLLDGTQMENYGQYFASGISVTPASDAASIALYGQYWLQKNVQNATQAQAALIAAADVALRKKGKRTITINPAPPDAINKGQPCPDPFTGYYLGDEVPVWAGRPQAGGGASFRDFLTPGPVVAGAWSNPLRVYALPISLGDDQVETVEQLLLADANE